MKHTSILWKNAGNMFPFHGKPRETRFHSMDNPMKHASIPGKTALLLALLLLSLLLLALPAAAVEVDASGAVPGRWTHDYPAAAALSRDQNLPLLLNFTGSDWCIWCKRMDASVFSTPLWKAYATNFALAFVDFPSDESALPPGAAERNRQLQQVHRVRGYPTFVLIAPSGTPLLQTSTDLDPESFIAWAPTSPPSPTPTPSPPSKPPLPRRPQPKKLLPPPPPPPPPLPMTTPSPSPTTSKLSPFPFPNTSPQSLTSAASRPSRTNTSAPSTTCPSCLTSSPPPSSPPPAT